MSRWFARFFVAALVASLVGVFGAISVSAAAGGGPDDALTPGGGAQSFASGGRLWYAFQRGRDQDATTQVRLASDPQGSAAFTVWTQNNVTDWQQGNDFKPIGSGTQQKLTPDPSNPDDQRVLFNGDLVWSGNLKETGTYYVVVDQTSPSAKSFTLTVTGSNLTLGAPGAQAAAAPASNLGAPETLPVLGTSPSTQPSNPSVSQAAPGSGPSSAVVLVNTVQTLNAGQQRWYSFKSSGSDFQTLIRLTTTGGNASFQVWTPESIAKWVSGDSSNPTGRGTVQTLRGPADDPDDKRILFNGDPIWSGIFAGPGMNYVLVQSQGSDPASFRLTISETLSARALAGE